MDPGRRPLPGSLVLGSKATPPRPPISALLTPEAPIIDEDVVLPVGADAAADDVSLITELAKSLGLPESAVNADEVREL
eukprot:4745339-Pyramimonas_sp.AAC.1